jgi:hypothetical protein
MGGISMIIRTRSVVITGGSRGTRPGRWRVVSRRRRQVVICGRSRRTQRGSRRTRCGERLHAFAAMCTGAEVEDLFASPTVEPSAPSTSPWSNMWDEPGRLSRWWSGVGGLERGFSREPDRRLPLCPQAARIMKKGGGQDRQRSPPWRLGAVPAWGINGVAQRGRRWLTKGAGLQLAPYRIQVNADAPGLVRTDFSKPLWSLPEIYDEWSR